MDIGNSADIHIHRAQRDAILLLGKDVAFALDGPLTREVHNMRGYAGAANLQNIGNLMLLNQRVAPQNFEDLLFPVVHIRP